MRAVWKKEWQNAVSVFTSGTWMTPEFIKAVIVPTLALVGLVLAEKLFAPILLPGRGLSFLYFIPIWMATKMKSRSSGLVVAFFTVIAMEIVTPNSSTVVSVFVNFILLTAVTLVFYQVEKNIARSIKLATTDPLTGLLSRRGFNQEALRAVSKMRLDREHGALILFDCDKFKQINDQLGHARGDDALRIIAKALKKSAHGDDVVGRLGGDEFVVLLQGTDSIGANIFLSRVKAAVQELAGDFPAPLRLSAGVCIFPTEARDLQTLIEIADEKMLRQKRAREEITHSVVGATVIERAGA